MNKKWPECVLGDLITLKRGYDLPRRERVLGSYPIVSSSGVSGFHNEAKVKAPGVVTGRNGTIGEVFYIKQDFWPLNTSLYVQDFKGNDKRFISYFLKTLHLESQNVGGAVPGVNRNHLHKLKLRCPPLPIQKKIAAILSAYDDLIENNNRRIALLEQMAEEIYREWFVRMRFPGYEQATFHQGVPEGWEVVKLGDVINIVMGQSPKSEFYNNRGDGLPFSQGVGTYGVRYPKHEVYCSVVGRIAQKGDILFSVRAPVGRLNIADCKMIIGRGLAAMNHKKGYNSYLFYMLRNHFTNEDMIGNGAIFNSVSKKELISTKILYPKDHLIRRCNNIVQKIDLKIANLYSSLKILKQTRDRLLSRLISGKLSVEQLDIQFPPSMEEMEEARESG